MAQGVTVAEYIDATFLQATADEFGLALSGTAAEKLQAIKRARLYLDAQPWEGRKTGGRDQVEQWPRAGVYDRDGYHVGTQEIPREIKLGNALLAIVEQSSPGALSPQVTLSQLVQSVGAGPASVRFRDAKGPSSARPIVTTAVDALAPLGARRNPLAMSRG